MSERNYFIFSSIAYSKSDSTANVVKDIEELYATYPFRALAYELAETYMANNRVNDANAVLQSYVPTADEQNEHAQLLSFYDVYSTLLSEERSTEELTAEELTTLQQLELLDGVVGAKARALLISSTGVDDYEEPRYLPEDNTAQREDNTINFVPVVEQVSIVEIYPNPADKQVTITYELPNIKEDKPLKIVITDILGREFSKQNAACCNGQIDIDISNLNAGNYVIAIYNAQGKLLNTKHLRVVK